MKIRQPKNTTLRRTTNTPSTKQKVKKSAHKIKKQTISTRTTSLANQNEQQHQRRLVPSQQQRNSATRISKSFYAI
eukprot:UN02444